MESGALPDRSRTWHQPPHHLDSLGHDRHWHEHHHRNNSQFAHLMDLQTAICGAEHCPKHQLRGQPWSCWHSGEFAWLSGRPSCSYFLLNFIFSDHWKDGLYFSRSNRFGNNFIFDQSYSTKNSIGKSSREGDYVHRRLWGTSHGSAVREVTFLIIGVKRAISCFLAIVSSTTSVHLVASLIPTTNQIPIISSSFDTIPINQIINLNHTINLNLSQLTIRFVLVGATSFSLVDCESPFPNVFSRCWFSQHQHQINQIHFRSQ